MLHVGALPLGGVWIVRVEPATIRSGLPMRLLVTGGTGVLGRALRPQAGYNVCRDGERVSAERFTRAAGWHPQH
jgi:hypothetical protein